MPDIPVATLHTLLRLDHETGRLYWRERGPEWFRDTEKRTAAHACANWNARYAGKEAFTAPTSKGYRQGVVLYRHILAHVVVFAMAHGRWPVRQIDHIDADPSNNRPANLREATPSQNQCNRRSGAGSSRFKGVCLPTGASRWVAYCEINGKRKYLGRFTDETAAARAYDAFARIEHGEFARLNFAMEEAIV